MKNRGLTEFIRRDLREKMVFIGGARQVGKTTLAKKLIAPGFKNSAYFNWDRRDDRERILRGEFPGDSELIIFDEVHKYRNWKNLIKGYYDTEKERYKFLITGSARLNVYRRGGDSLQGRYHYYRLHPFTLAELIQKRNNIELLQEIKIESKNHPKAFDDLMTFGGFPEILLRQSQRALRRWHNEKIERLFSEDIRDLTQIRDIGTMKLLCDCLPKRVGSLLSINSIREDLSVSHRAVSNWLDTLEIFYYHFRIFPYATRAGRSIKKDPKLYLFDWSEIENEAFRFENLIASHLLKFVHFLYDYEGHKVELNFLRNVDGKEVDFLLSVKGKPWFCVESKLNDTTPSPMIKYFRDRLRIPFCYQIVQKPKVNLYTDGIRIISADQFLSALL